MKKAVLNLKNKTVGDIELDTTVFGVKKLPDLIQQYIRYQMLNQDKDHIKQNLDLKLLRSKNLFTKRNR